MFERLREFLWAFLSRFLGRRPVLQGLKPERIQDEDEAETGDE